MQAGYEVTAPKASPCANRRPAARAKNKLDGVTGVSAVISCSARSALLATGKS